jgi:hypothetical protein
MTSSPDEVRTGLTIVTSAAAAELVASAEPAETASDLRALLFLAAPVIVSDYSDGAAALALDWYEELREAAETKGRYAPEPFRVVTDEYVRAQVAAATVDLHDVPSGRLEEVKRVSLSLVADSLPEMVADGFRETITRNAINDPASAGWKRFARPDACKFCKMLAAKGAVFTEKTARFAAHGAVMNGGRKGGDCMCIAGPEFGGRDTWSEATPIQYVASQRKRSPQQRLKLREYLTENFPDAPG